MKDIKTATEKDLLKLLTDKRETLRQFRFNSAGSKTKNVREGRALRKEVAQVLTALASRKKHA